MKLSSAKYKKSLEELEKYQTKKLDQMIGYVYKYVPYYTNLLNTQHIDPSDIKSTTDLTRIPITTKDEIRENIELFKPSKKQLKYIHYFCNATGGTTGTPLKYRISRIDRLLEGVLLYVGWGFAGYKLADRMVTFGGTSLSINKSSNLYKKLNEYFRNVKKISAFDMSEKDLKLYTTLINNFKPKFLRGYPSAIFFLTQWVEENNVNIYKPQAIFTTSEKLYPYMREKIEQIFNCKIFDTYGLNDGGLSAFECAEHNGMHIDMDRGILQVIDDMGNIVKEGTGRIVATDLYNYSFPFIRYDTGDIGTITYKPCTCGLNTPRLTEIQGRSVDILLTPEGVHVHGWFFLYLFWKYQEGIKQYQVIQKTSVDILIKIVPTKSFNESILNIIKNIVQEKSSAWNVKFDIVDKISPTDSGKFKFIVSELI